MPEIHITSTKEKLMQKCNKELSGGKTATLFLCFSFFCWSDEIAIFALYPGYGTTMISSVDHDVIISFCSLLAVRFRQFVYDLC